MPQKIARIGIKKCKSHAYFVDNDGDVACIDTSGKREKIGKVVKVGLKKCKDYIYFIDEDGDVSSEESSKICPELFTSKEEYEKVLELEKRNEQNTLNCNALWTKTVKLEIEDEKTEREEQIESEAEEAGLSIWFEFTSFIKRIGLDYESLDEQLRETIRFCGFLWFQFKNFKFDFMYGADNYHVDYEDCIGDFKQLLLTNLDKNDPIFEKLIQKIDIIRKIKDLEKIIVLLTKNIRVLKKLQSILFKSEEANLSNELLNYFETLSQKDRKIISNKEEELMLLLRKNKMMEEIELANNAREYEETQLLKKLKEEEHNKLRIDRLRQKVKQEILEKEFQDIPEDERIRFISDDVKEFVWRRDQGKCVKCGSSEKLEFDHIIPFSKGGSNTARNIQLLCEKCNRSKHDNI